MDARRLVGAATWAVLLCGISAAFGQTSYRAVSENFVVTAPHRGLAEQVATQAEKYRRELAKEWLGTQLPNWTEKCPVVVEIAPLPGGETSFVFVGPPGTSEPKDWQMRVFGPPDRILDSVLPHEVTHTIFATYFRRPLPRWADEGACTTVEHESEREKNHRMLMNFLTARPSRGIPFNQMFTMKQYPHDILPLYAQGYSLSRYLIMQRGKRHFVAYIQSGLERERPGQELSAWTETTQQYYGYRDLSELQVAWVGWVKDGCQTTPTVLASHESEFSSESGEIGLRLAAHESPIGHPNVASGSVNDDPSWYRQQMVAAKTNPSDTRVANAQFAPGSTAQGNLAILESWQTSEPFVQSWKAVPVPATTGDERATVWR
ncbi:MAG TPA: hypothetical protein PKD54_05165 [Pirellulaceae bacterium]|nr:hypothetical protein [Pirellulaceae bacterium]